MQRKAKASAKLCRWMDHLDPKIKKANFTQEEELVIFGEHKKLGNKWVKIAELLEGRYS